MYKNRTTFIHSYKHCSDYQQKKKINVNKKLYNILHVEYIPQWHCK